MKDWKNTVMKLLPDIKTQINDYQYMGNILERFFPCGVLEFSTYAIPKLIYLSDTLLEDFVSEREDYDDWLSLMRENAITMLPFYERKRLVYLIKDEQKNSEKKHQKRVLFNILDVQGKLQKMEGWVCPTAKTEFAGDISMIMFKKVAEETMPKDDIVFTKRSTVGTGYESAYPKIQSPIIDYYSVIKNQHVVFKTFGYFEMFVDGVPIKFSSKKAKELLAIIVDLRGGFVSPIEAVSYLWPEEEVNKTLMARYRKVASHLKNTLIDYGVGNVLCIEKGQRRLNMEILRCDLFDYLSGNPVFQQLYHGLYMLDYDWAEKTREILSLY